MTITMVYKKSSRSKYGLKSRLPRRFKHGVKRTPMQWKFSRPMFGAHAYPKLARLVGGYVQRRRASQSTRNLLAETKLLPLTVYNQKAPNPIQAGAKCYYMGFCLQSVPTGWDTGLNDLSGIDIAQGVTGTTRIGNYVYYKKSHLTLQIDMNASVYQAPPTEFRFIIAKSRQSVMPAGSTDQPQTTLFLNTVGAQQGYQTAGFNGMDAMLMPLNKRDWVIFKDRKFTLSSPMMSDSDGGNVGYSGKYRCRKSIMCNLNHYKKTRLNPNNLPSDYDAHYLVYIFASSMGKDFNALNWEVSTRGTTSLLDA